MLYYLPFWNKRVTATAVGRKKILERKIPYFLRMLSKTSKNLNFLRTLLTFSKSKVVTWLLQTPVSPSRYGCYGTENWQNKYGFAFYPFLILLRLSYWKTYTPIIYSPKFFFGWVHQFHFFSWNWKSRKL